VRYVKYSFFLIFTVAFVLFAVANRAPVELSFFPLPYMVAMPLFLFTMLCIASGVVLAGIALGLRTSKARGQYKAEHKRVMALENELEGMRAEKQLLAAPEAEEKPKQSLAARLFRKAA
jgi:putative membrane protein